MYTPKPRNLSDVILPEELTALTEAIAENVHEAWAAARLAEGWRYDTERSDERKTTPCLVPYDELPEIEKEYDRRTAIDTLKQVVSMGYTIQKA